MICYSPSNFLQLPPIISRRSALKGSRPTKNAARASPAEFTDEKFGVPTVRDILTELEKPGRDPRPEFKTATFREGVESLSDLQPGMVLEGVVTNVAAFGAFVDIGVHQDGLVHVSALANKFVKDPHDVVKPGQVVKVKVLDVDLKRQRISLTMRIDDAAGRPVAPIQSGSEAARDARGRGQSASGQAAVRAPQPIGAMAMALAKARQKS
ncbi:MAG: S1 RNA-binding domain-containing protein [Nitrospira sp.]|nr:S1 RNA-binding domain-containing protein [Nitrospira sp.]